MSTVLLLSTCRTETNHRLFNWMRWWSIELFTSKTHFGMCMLCFSAIASSGRIVYTCAGIKINMHGSQNSNSYAWEFDFVYKKNSFALKILVSLISRLNNRMRTNWTPLQSHLSIYTHRARAQTQIDCCKSKFICLLRTKRIETSWIQRRASVHLLMLFKCFLFI